MDYGNATYRVARSQAFARSKGKCQLCGQLDAESAHHWAWPEYPEAEETTASDLTALCQVCHDIATVLRRYSGDKHTFRKRLQEVFDEIQSPDRGNSPRHSP